MIEEKAYMVEHLASNKHGWLSDRAIYLKTYLVAWQTGFPGRICLRSVKNMERENILVKILGLVEGFIQKVMHLN